MLTIYPSCHFLLFQKTEISAKFDLMLKVKRGQKVEKFMVEVDETMQGTFHLNQMRQQDSDSGFY